MDFSGQKRPIDKAMYLVEEAGKAFKHNKDVKAFVAPAKLTTFQKDVKGPHINQQTRIVVVSLEDQPIEVLFLNNNNKKVLNRLKELGVPVSEKPQECKDARIVALREVPPKVEVPTVFPEETKMYNEKKDLVKPKRKRGRPKKVKSFLDMRIEAREKERKEKRKKRAPATKKKPEKKEKTKEE